MVRIENNFQKMAKWIWLVTGFPYMTVISCLKHRHLGNQWSDAHDQMHKYSLEYPEQKISKMNLIPQIAWLPGDVAESG